MHIEVGSVTNPPSLAASDQAIGQDRTERQQWREEGTCSYQHQASARASMAGKKSSNSLLW
jgi:hypothetical protein